MTNQPEEQNRKLQDLLLKLGLSYLERNRFQDAFDKLTQLLDLEPKNKQALFLATKAAIALKNISDDALDLYTRALDANLQLKTCQQLRVLLENHASESPILSEIRHKLDALNIPDQDDLPESHLGEPVEITQPVKDPHKEFSTKIEALWCSAKFDEAIKTIHESEDLSDDFLQKQMALTHAYQSLANKQYLTETESIKNALTQMEQLKSDSLDSLREMIALAQALPEETAESNGRHDDSAEFEFILGKIAMEDFFHDLQKKKEQSKTRNEYLDDIIFNELQTAREWNPENEIISYKWCTFLITSLNTRGNKVPPEKIIDLVATYLYKIPRSVLRITKTGFLSFAINPLKQVIAVLNLYDSINHYNKAAVEHNKITISSSIITLSNIDGDILDAQSFPANVLKALHLHKLTKTQSHEDLSLRIACKKSLLTELIQLDESIKYKLQKNTSLLSGIISECYSVKKQVEENDSPLEIQDLKILEQLKKQLPFVTYIAKNKQLERSVILKTISYKEKTDHTKKQKENILSNIKKMGRLNHPNIATLFDLGENNEQIYYTREYVEGESILSFDKAQEGWKIRFLAMLEKIIRGLQTAAQDQIYHLNLKPSNIWINEASTLKLTDFNIFQNKNYEKDAFKNNSTRYLAPEVISSGKGDSRSDIYSLGLITYEILTGNSPYNGVESLNSGVSPSLELSENKHPELNPSLIKILRRATHAKPEKRFQTLPEFETEVKKLYAELAAEAQEA